MVVARLLPVLTQRSATCMCLVRLEPWHALMQGFAGQVAPLRALADPTARALARTLVVAASGLDNVREGQGYIENLLRPMTGRATSCMCAAVPTADAPACQSHRVKIATCRAALGTEERWMTQDYLKWRSTQASKRC